MDISTGDFWVAEGTTEQIEQLLQSFSPSEVLVPKPKKKLFQENFGLQYHCFYMEDWAFELSTAQEKLTTHFQTNSLEGFGVQRYTVGISAAGAVIALSIRSSALKIAAYYPNFTHCSRGVLFGWIDLLSVIWNCFSPHIRRAYPLFLFWIIPKLLWEDVC